MCPFLHITSVEQARYETSGKATERLKREIGRTLQESYICGDFKSGTCERQNCNRRHINTDPLECRICHEQINIDNLGASVCGHMLCYTCALKCIPEVYEIEGGNENDLIKIKCPMCRTVNEYKKFS